MHKNKWRQSTDAHRHSSELGRTDAGMLGVVSREGAWWRHSLCSGRKKMPNSIFTFLRFSEKQKSSLDFFWLGKNRYRCRSFEKTKLWESELSKSGGNLCLQRLVEIAYQPGACKEGHYYDPHAGKSEGRQWVWKPRLRRRVVERTAWQELWPSVQGCILPSSQKPGF